MFLFLLEMSKNVLRSFFFYWDHIKSKQSNDINFENNINLTWHLLKSFSQKTVYAIHLTYAKIYSTAVSDNDNLFSNPYTLKF